MRIAVLCNDRLALPALRQLLASGLTVAVGVTNRSAEIQQIVRNQCAQAGVPVQEFDKKNFPAMLTAWLQQHRPDLVLIKTFPFLIPAEVLALPKYGFINFHYAPLPQWRGPSPLFWMIRNRVSLGGVTVHRVDETFDTGKVLLRKPVSIGPEMTFGMLCSRLAFAGQELLPQLLQGLLKDDLKPIEQDSRLAGWHRRPKPEDLFIDWNTMSASEIRALVNACNPWNKGAGTRWNNWTFGITDTSMSSFPVTEGTVPGSVLTADKVNGLVIACKDRMALRIEIIYSEEGFLAGYRVAQFGLLPGMQLEGVPIIAGVPSAG
jgi:methionyl-tRNA formyltransferase